MTVTTNDRGQQNLFAREPKMYVDETYVDRYGYETYAERAEKLNGRTAMVGFIFALLSYSVTGNLFFGLAWFIHPYLTRTMNENAERINGLAAMVGIVAAMGAYALTGQVIPGIWWAYWL